MSDEVAEPSTLFAPAERADDASVERAWRTLGSLEFVQEVINAMPVAAAVLNRERQIVFWNEALFESVGARDLGEVLGLRPGEALGCVHAAEQIGGCGTAEACRHCGAAGAILRCLMSDAPAEQECRICTSADGHTTALDLRVATRPFRVRGEAFILLTLTDIGDMKRRRALERLFFHDIINLAGGLRGMLELMQQIGDADRLHRFTKDLSAISDSLVDEIVAQRELLAAESGDYRPRPDDLAVADLFGEVVHHMRHHDAARTHQILMDPPAGDLVVRADHNLARRVLVNMLKNALEASPRGSDVRIFAQAGDETDGAKLVRLSVHNVGFMPREVQLQMFQRSFSTKGADRGLGTYSMKLFTERYLGGRLSFESSHETGTTFTAELPAAARRKSSAPPPRRSGSSEPPAPSKPAATSARATTDAPPQPKPSRPTGKPPARRGSPAKN
jgi:signal transduction histidine kinase